MPLDGRRDGQGWAPSQQGRVVTPWQLVGGTTERKSEEHSVVSVSSQLVGAVATGLDILIRDGFKPLLGKAIGMVCNQATVANDYMHITEHLLPLHGAGKLK